MLQVNWMLLACFVQTLSLFRQLKNVASRVFKGHFTSETGPRWNIFPGFRKCRNAWIFLYIALLQIPPANTACSLGVWGVHTPHTDVFISENISKGQGIRTLHLFLAAGFAHKVVQPSFVNPSFHKSSASTGLLFSFNPRSRALAQHFRALCQKLGFTASWEDGEADGQHADTEADSRLDKRLSGITRIPRAKPPQSLRGFWNVFVDMFQVILLWCHCHVLHCHFARLQ